MSDLSELVLNRVNQNLYVFCIRHTFSMTAAIFDNNFLTFQELVGRTHYLQHVRSPSFSQTFSIDFLRQRDSSIVPTIVGILYNFVPTSPRIYDPIYFISELSVNNSDNACFSVVPYQIG